MSSRISYPLLRRVVRQALLGAFAIIPFAACSDDDNDGISGPVADCIDQIDFDEWFFEENDLEALRLGDEESGVLRATDVPDGDFFYDIYVFALQSDSDVTITVDPSGDFDPVYIINTLEAESDFVNDEGPGVTEEVTYIDVAEGCYLLYVSSANVEGTGSYTVEVDDI